MLRGIGTIQNYNNVTNLNNVMAGGQEKFTYMFSLDHIYRIPLSLKFNRILSLNIFRSYYRGGEQLK